MARPKNNSSKRKTVDTNKIPRVRKGPGRVGGQGLRVHKITPKQQEWIKHFVTTGNIARSARACGVRKTVAWDWHKSQKIQDEIAKIRDTIRDETGYDLKMAMAECEEAIEFSRGMKNANAYVKAVELKTKLNGLLIEKHDHRMVANFSIQVEGVRDQVALPPVGGVVIDTPEVKQLMSEAVEHSVVADREKDELAELGL
jgi:hypothetical protein